MSAETESTCPPDEATLEIYAALMEYDDLITPEFEANNGEQTPNSGASATYRGDKFRKLGLFVCLIQLFYKYPYTMFQLFDGEMLAREIENYNVNFGGVWDDTATRRFAEPAARKVQMDWLKLKNSLKSAG